jgi:transmembrane protein
VFTFLTILIVHAFWRLEGERAITALHTAGEHVGMIGALILVSILALRPRSEFRSTADAQALTAASTGMLQR